MKKFKRSIVRIPHKAFPSQLLRLQFIDDLVEANPFVFEMKIIGSRGGRPTVMTKETVQKLERAFAYDCTVTEACVYGGISRDTYYAFCKQYPEFSDRISEIKNIPILALRFKVLSTALEDGNLALKYLERKRPQEFV